MLHLSLEAAEVGETPTFMRGMAKMINKYSPMAHELSCGIKFALPQKMMTILEKRLFDLSERTVAAAARFPDSKLQFYFYS